MDTNMKDVQESIREADSRWKEVFWFGISTLIILGMVYFAGVEDFVNTLARADLYLVAPALLLGVSTFVVWSFTWYRVFQRIGIEAGFFESIKLHMAGTFLNAVTPLGQFGGEPLMAYIISSNSESSYEKALSAVVSADLINILPPFTFVFGGAIYATFFYSVNDVIIEILYLSIVGILFGGVFIYFLWFKAGKIEGAILRFLEKSSAALGKGEKLVEKAEKRLKRFENSVGAIGEDPGYLAKTVLMVHAGFVLEVLCLYLVLLSLGIDTGLTMLYFVLPLSDIANTSPTPGGSGTYEAAMAGLLVLLVGMNFTLALSAAILYRLMTYWPSLFIGYIAFNRVQNGDRK